MTHTYFNNRRKVLQAADMIRAQYSPTLREDLRQSIRQCRSFLAMYRAGEEPNQNSWDCGRQDAYGDMVEAMFERLETLMGAWQLKNGRTTKLAKAIAQGIGAEDLLLMLHKDSR